MTLTQHILGSVGGCYMARTELDVRKALKERLFRLWCFDDCFYYCSIGPSPMLQRITLLAIRATRSTKPAVTTELA
ncbi:hypothetical protein SHAL103562_16840 [Shewanella algae]